MDDVELLKFLEESNRIERIFTVIGEDHKDVARDFLGLPRVEVADLCAVVSAFQPGAILRDRPGLDVMVGNHIPPSGGPEIRDRLGELLMATAGRREDMSAVTPLWSPFQAHCEYENLHPFTDGNGRSGRLLWLWQMRSAPLGFLHHFYYQTLASRRLWPR